MKILSVKYKVLTALLTLALTFQSMESINSHTYNTKGSHIHIGQPCLCIVKNHLLYYCNEYRKF
jgi:hypothetical protein